MAHKSPAFQFYPDSWLSSLSITLMTPAEEGAYIRLLCHAWMSSDCGLPADSDSLKVLSRLGVGWIKSETKLRSQFVQEGDRLFNHRLLLERTKQQVWRDKSSKGGKKSGATRSQPESKGGSLLVDDCLQPNSNTSSPSSSSVKSIEPAPKRGASRKIPFDFPELPAEWEAWAVKKNKWGAERIGREFEKFSFHSKKNDTRWKDWYAAWQHWCANAVEFEPRRNGGLFENPVPQRAPVTTCPKCGGAPCQCERIAWAKANNAPF